ncbi:cytochrome P450 [Streptomyces sp. NBC_00083]|uniref:cytochrome P450 n=1 Tax=Streptomyces sp. NBC_00083 TaxID=2975647 RepID=UPI0022587BB1|nr:cytochrome P450 [Streptomyces sp. NBC_00083]MCX5388042.1 cytochrome P450 [Streptomyces sp. NBC_00083]
MTATTAPATPTVPCPQAPGRVPVLGHVPALLRRPLTFFESIRTHDPLVRVEFGRFGLYLASDPALVHRIQVDSDAFERGRFFDVLAGHFGNPPIATDGADHRHQRRTIQPAFSRTSVRDYTRTIVDEAERRFGAWRPGVPVAADEEVSDFVAAVVLRCLFSVDLDRALVRDIRHTLSLISGKLFAGTVFPEALTSLPTPANRRFEAAMGRFHAVIDALIQDRRTTPGVTPDVLDILLKATHPDTGRPFTDHEIRGEFLILVFAALETTSTSLTWAVFETAIRPAVQRRLYEESRRVLGGQPLGYDSVKEFTYTRKVVDETLRLHAPMLSTRRARHDVVLAGTLVPAGSEVGYSPRAMHRDPATYSDPHRFDPDRPEATPGQAPPPGAYAPWGLGVHRCIGEHLAATTMTAALATLATRWELRIAPGARIRMANSSLPHLRGLPLVVTPRG